MKYRKWRKRERNMKSINFYEYPWRYSHISSYCNKCDEIWCRREGLETEEGNRARKREAGRDREKDAKEKFIIFELEMFVVHAVRMNWDFRQKTSKAMRIDLILWKCCVCVTAFGRKTLHAFIYDWMSQLA